MTERRSNGSKSNRKSRNHSRNSRFQDAFASSSVRRVDPASIIPVVKAPKLHNGTVVERNQNRPKRAAVDFNPVQSQKSNKKPYHRTVNLLKVESGAEMQKILELCYKDLPHEHMKTGPEGVQALWKRIRDAAKIALLRFPVDCKKSGVDIMIWNYHYKILTEGRERLKRRVMQMKSRNSVSDKSIAESEEGKILSIALDDILKFYMDLVKRVEKQQAKLDKKDEPDEKDLQCLDAFDRILCTCFIAMGDVQRYRVTHLSVKHSREKKWNLPISAYHRSLEFQRGMGQAHNKLALIALEVADYYACSYQYIRACSALKPTPSRDNLKKILETTRRFHIECKGGRVPQKWQRRVGFRALNEYQIFLLAFVRLIGILVTHIGMDQSSHLFRQTLMDFDFLFRDKKLTDKIVAQLVMMCIFAIHENHRLSKQDELEYDTLGFCGQSSVNLLLDLLANVIKEASQNWQRLPFISVCAMACIYLNQHPDFISHDHESAIFFRTCLASLSNVILEKQEHKKFADKVNPEEDFDVKEFLGCRYVEDAHEDIESLNMQGLGWQFEAIQECAEKHLYWVDEKAKYVVDEATAVGVECPNSQDSTESSSSGMVLPEAREGATKEESVTQAEKQMAEMLGTGFFLGGTMTLQDYRPLSPESGMEDEFTETPRSGAVVVIDAPNVCMEAGEHKAFQCGGLKKAIDFFVGLNCKVVAVMPAFYLDYDCVDRAEKIKKWDPTDRRGRASLRPDNIRLLRELKKDGIVFTTPKGDYDDSYTIQFAQSKHGVIVSNDRFRDAITKKEKRRDRKAMSGWLKTHVMTYCFVDGEFIANPDFRYPRS